MLKCYVNFLGNVLCIYLIKTGTYGLLCFNEKRIHYLNID